MFNYTGQIILFTGTEFKATAIDGRIEKFRMVGLEVTRDCKLRLLNLETNRILYVKSEWFEQHEIEILKKDPDSYD